MTYSLRIFYDNIGQTFLHKTFYNNAEQKNSEVCMRELIKQISTERPVGSEGNNRVNEILEAKLIELGYEVKSLPFECTVWNHGKAVLSTSSVSCELKVSPFSEGFSGEGYIRDAENLNELKAMDLSDSIIVVHGELTKEQLQPKDYPFYYPDEHREIIELLERKAPLAIIALTGKSEMCGLDPFPLFADGNFLIPSAYTDSSQLDFFKKLTETGERVFLNIESAKEKKNGRQLVGLRKAKNSMESNNISVSRDQFKKTVVLCAHMDSTYDSPGALDNATGVIAMLETAGKIRLDDYNIEIVPFNGEEHYESNGELEYIQYSQEEEIALAVNYDSPFCKGALTGVSFYNFNEEQLETVEKLMNGRKVERGVEWYAGDHSKFAFDGTPCMAVTSANLFEGALDSTHTPMDLLDTVSLDNLEDTADYIIDCIKKLLN